MSSGRRTEILRRELSVLAERSNGEVEGRPAAEWDGLSDVTLHTLRHSFVANLVAAG